jgi:hypothetical protein
MSRWWLAAESPDEGVLYAAIGSGNAIAQFSV